MEKKTYSKFVNEARVMKIRIENNFTNGAVIYYYEKRIGKIIYVNESGYKAYYMFDWVPGLKVSHKLSDSELKKLKIENGIKNLAGAKRTAKYVMKREEKTIKKFLETK